MKNIFILLFPILFFNSSITLCQDCGVERWDIKTLADADTSKIDFTKIIVSTVHEQAAIAKPYGKLTYRTVTESKIYSIDCFLIGYKIEDDKDIHLIIEDINTDETMVAEIPSASCSSIQNTSRAKLFSDLHNWFLTNIGHPTSSFVFLEKHIPITITGVGYFDFMHGQKGMALNGREIHPVLTMKLQSPLK